MDRTDIYDFILPEIDEAIENRNYKRSFALCMEHKDESHYVRVRLADHYEHGWGVDRNVFRAVRELKTALMTDPSDTDVMMRLARIHDDDSNTILHDRELATLYTIRAAENGDVEANLTMARHFEKAGKKAEAFFYYNEAKGESPEAMFKAGDYLRREGDPDDGWPLILSAAESDWPEALYTCGLAFSGWIDGGGIVDVDQEKALEMQRRYHEKKPTIGRIIDSVLKSIEEVQNR